jgi:hypothetical protein
MFKLSAEEARQIEGLRSQVVILNSDGTTPPECLRSQSVTLEKRGRHRKYSSNVFTEQGIAMLSSVLTSERAILVNIEIIRSFTRLRYAVAQNQDLALRLEQLETRHNHDISLVFDAIEQLRDNPAQTIETRRRIGFPQNRSHI